MEMKTAMATALATAQKGTSVDMMNKHNIMLCACVVAKQVAMKIGVGEL